MRYWLPALIAIGLTIYAIADIAQHPQAEPYRLPKVVWILVVLFAPIVGAVSWIIAKFIAGGSGGSLVYDEPTAPDDDPAFKAWLDERERRKRRRGGASQ